MAVPAEQETRYRGVSGIALVAFAAALLAALAVLMSGLGTRWGLWHFRTGLTMLRWGGYASLATAALSIISGVVAHPGSARKGFWFAAGGLAISLAVLAVVVPVRMNAQKVPPIHDITTDFADPPRFVAVLPLRKDASNPAEYEGQAVAAQQRAAYPDITPVTLPVPPDRAYQRALAAAREMGWEMVDENPGQGRIEATDTTYWFGFKDDVVIRIRQGTGAGSRVDIRSVSRVGRGDVGKNAQRVRAYLERLRNQH